MTAVLPGPTDFSRYDSAPLLCELSCLADHVLTTSSMFYLSILSLSTVIFSPLASILRLSIPLVWSLLVLRLGGGGA